MIGVEQIIQGTNVEPRPYQGRIVNKALDLFLNKNLRSILIESPTGSGKTVMGLMTATGLQKAKGLKVGWVAMRRNLLTQTAEEISERGLDVKVEFISMFEKNPPKNLDLLIVDEAQHDAANSMAHLHAVIQPKYILGLSATPYRADKVKLCFDSVIRDAGIQQLIQDGFLSRYHHFTIPAYNPAGVAETYLREPERWGKSIVFFHKLPDCYALQRLLADAGVRSEVVTGSSDRETQLANFEAGKADVLINCMVLTEGFDCPSLKTAFCRPSVRGVTIQMAGRAFRKHADLPIKQIVQCQKTKWPFIRTATAECQYVWTDGAWRSLTINPEIQQLGLNMLQALAKTEVKLPEYLTKRMGRQKPRYEERDESIMLNEIGG